MLSARRKRLVVAVAVLVGGVVSASGAAMATLGSEPHSGPAFDVARAEAGRSQLSTLSTEQLKFPALSRPLTSRDAMPSSVRAEFAPAGAVSSTGVNLDLARSYATSAGTGWVIPGQDTVCVAQPDPRDGFGESCVETAFALTHGAISVLIDPRAPRTAHLAVILPADGSATVRYRDGHEQSLDETDRGVIYAAVTDAADIVVTASGTVSEFPIAQPDLSPIGVGVSG